MRRVGYSVFIAELRLFKSCGGMRGGYGAYFCRFARKLNRPGKLGCQRHKPYLADFVELFKLVYVRLAQIFGILCAALCIREERPLHIDAVNISAALFADILGRSLKRPLYPVIGQGHRRGAERGHAEACERFRHCFERVRQSVGEIRPTAAVNMYVYKSGQNDAAREVVLLCAA